MKTRQMAMAAAMTVLVSAGDMEAQAADTAHRAKLRADCRLAEQILTEGQPAVKRDWALGVIGACPGLADVLAQLWRDPPTDEQELEKLFSLSREVRDCDVFTAVREVASSPSRPSLSRIAALAVLGSYLRPTLILDFDGLQPREDIGPIGWSSVWGRGSDLPPQEEGDPLPDDFEETTRQLVEQLSESEEDSKVRAAAWWLVPKITEPGDPGT